MLWRWCTPGCTEDICSIPAEENSQRNLKTGEVNLVASYYEGQDLRPAPSPGTQLSTWPRPAAISIVSPHRIFVTAVPTC